MSVSPSGPLASTLKAVAMTDDVALLRPLLQAEATLDASLADEPRRQVAGREDVLEEFSRWFGTEAVLIDWAEEEFAGTLVVELERLEPATGAVRRLRLELQHAAGVVARARAFEERPRGDAMATSETPPPDLGAGETRRVRALDGWIGRATRDPGREALLPWDRMRAALDPGVERVVEAASGGWWVAGRSAAVPGGARAGSLGATPGGPLGAAAPWGVPGLGTALASLHAEFAGEPGDDEPPAQLAALCSLEDRLTLCAPATAVAERGGPDLLPKMLELGWECFAAVVPERVAAAVARVHADPAPLARALRAAAPPTLLHGDLTRAGIETGAGPVLVTGWHLATWGPAQLDLPGDDPAPLIVLARLVTDGWRLGRAALAHPDPAVGERSEAELARCARRVADLLD